ncbi:MAG: Transaldolase [Brockia lithotrophica]|uniref:Probable transaldolase n=1 Tax=Brockia lithotrophica TaxID=933949 RepID=A0A2T5GB51_9BACL|nr:fructose-6-phosphate aldolase [Brockia lithotrophica]PTQ53415.1 MAG: Transaldolase [Brockia lithotrophica]
MKIFLDTAEVAEIRAYAELGVVDGVTTNPSLVAQTGRRDLPNLIREIADVVNGPISVEVIATDTEGMIREAREIAAWGLPTVVKIPMTHEGLRAVRVLSREGISTNVTLVFTALQGLLAAKAGATYVSPFAGRLDDIVHDGMDVVRDLVHILRTYDLPTQVIASSIRHPLHVLEAARVGAHVVTVPPKVLGQILRHPLTDAGIERFLRDWQTLQNQGNSR